MVPRLRIELSIPAFSRTTQSPQDQIVIKKTMQKMTFGVRQHQGVTGIGATTGTSLKKWGFFNSVPLR